MSDQDNKRRGRLWGGSRPQDAAQILPIERSAERSGRPAPESTAYVAFELRDGAARIEIECAASPSRFPAYSYLLDVIYDRFHQSAFSLVYSFMVVNVRGANLEPVVHAVNFGQCELIREFDPRRHDRPDQTEPLIEAIEIVARDEMPQA